MKKLVLTSTSEIEIEELSLEEFFKQWEIHDSFYEEQITAFAHTCCSTT
ncbi:MAG: hypothetical protein KC478_14115 [Bacteriovoracaceae bacterium]|nr:hypothetical protein [Bacteriovoracaceae bacterium]